MSALPTITRGVNPDDPYNLNKVISLHQPLDKSPNLPRPMTQHLQVKKRDQIEITI